MRHWFDDAAFNARVGLPVKAPHVVVKDYGPIFEAFADGITDGEAAYRGDGSKPFIAFHPGTYRTCPFRRHAACVSIC